MTSSMSGYDLRYEREAVESFPVGSRQRMVGELWIEWLEHVRRCQAALNVPGCMHDYQTIGSFESWYLTGWNCCDTHAALKEARRKLHQQAEDLGVSSAPHHTDEVLTERWWRERNHPYVVGVPVN